MVIYGVLKISEVLLLLLKTSLLSSLSVFITLLFVSPREVIDLSFDLFSEFLEVDQRPLGLVLVLH